MVISQKSQESNRKNAQHSTGPKTPEGKKAASLNAVTYGLRTRHLLINGENIADHWQLWDGLETRWQPETPTERLYLEQMSPPSGCWRGWPPASTVSMKQACHSRHATKPRPPTPDSGERSEPRRPSPIIFFKSNHMGFDRSVFPAYLLRSKNPRSNSTHSTASTPSTISTR